MSRGRANRYNIGELDVARVRTLRRERELRQKDAARLAGMRSVQAWNNIERGARPRVSWRTLERMARALSCEPETLLKQAAISD